MDGAAEVKVRVRPPVSPARAWWSVFVFTVALMLNFLDRQVMTLLVTPIKRDLHLSDTQMSLLIGFMFALFYVIVGLPLSRLVDRGTRKWVVGAGITLWSLMTAACGLAQSFGTLALARMGVGVGESCNAPGTYSMASDMFPRDKLARAISVIGIGTVAGQGMALLVGGTVIVALVKLGTVTLPVLGTLHAWQLTFMIVGLPGILWALLLMATVPEPPRRGETTAAAMPSLGAVGRFLGAWRSAYLPCVLVVGISAMLTFGTNVWSPSLFERKFGWGPGVPGLYLGLISLLVSPLGLVLGGWLADRRLAQGHDDAAMWVCSRALVGVVPFAILFPLMPTPALSLAMLAASLFFGSMNAGPANAAVLTITPGRMRGTITALYIAIYNVLGYGVGPLIVALLTDRLFRDEQRLPTSMAIAAALLAPLGLACSRIALRPYARAAAAARERGD